MIFKIIGCVVFGGFAVLETIGFIKAISYKKNVKVDEKSPNKVN